MIKVQVAAALSVYYIILQFTKQFKCFISGTVVNSLLGYEAHAVFVAVHGELAHFGPLVLIRIII